MEAAATEAVMGAAMEADIRVVISEKAAAIVIPTYNLVGTNMVAAPSTDGISTVDSF